MLQLPRWHPFVAPAGEPLIMGIVNASPESFSDGGIFDSLEAQVTRAEELAAAGAASSTSVGSRGHRCGTAVPDEEIRRVAPLVERLVALGIVVSVDTWKPSVARACSPRGPTSSTT